MANSSGGFVAQRNLSYTAPLGFVNATGASILYPAISLTTNFTVLQRVAVLVTDLAVYGRSDTVNITGFNFSRLGDVNVSIFYNSTGDRGSGFPLGRSTDDAGIFEYLWDTGTWCNGRYRVEANDTARPWLNATAYFNISEQIQAIDIVTASGGYNSVSASPISVALINVSDAQEETASSNQGATWYFEINFSNNFNRGLSIESVLLKMEHRESAGMTGPTLTVWNGSQYLGVACADLNAAATGHNDTCDLTTMLNTSQKLDNVSVRYTLTKSGGGGQQMYLNYIHLNITTSYQPSCTYFNGSSGGGLAANPPSVQSVLLDDALSSPADEIDLAAGARRLVRCNATVSDNDGYQTIQSVNATIYHESSAPGDLDSNLSHYTNSSCTQVTGAGASANYTCAFQLVHYAANGTWTCRVAARDATDISYGTDTAWLNPLFAINISPSLVDFGKVPTGNLSGNLTVNITNIGSQAMNISVYGYGDSPSDGYAYKCPVGGLAIGVLRHTADSAVPYALKTSLASTPSHLNLTIPAQTDAAIRRNETYWQLQVPGGFNDFGECNGTVVFQAEAP